MNKQEISARLTSLNFNPDVLLAYDETHRYYHTFQHLIEVLNYLEDHSGNLDDALFLAAVYHDIIYNPKSKNNEEDSAKKFKQDALQSGLKTAIIDETVELILDTAHHQPKSVKSKLFIEADLAIFNSSTERLIEYEKQIFKEYQFVDFNTYRKNRIRVLEKFNSNDRLNFLISYVKTFKPAIAVFPGSFNPFHRGHFNVLKKAECIFDKVIIAFGKNPEKQIRTWDIPKTIQNRQIESYEGLVTDFVDSLGYEAVIIRGLRNSTDFQYEQNQYRYIQELKPQVRIVSIFCDKEFEHISSSGIRTLEKYNKHQHYLLD